MSNGGIIGPDNIPTLDLASGVWTINEVADAVREQIWPGLVPAVVTNADLWLDATDATTITESGGAVSQWDNKGSLGNFTQSTGALQPTTGVSTLNGLNILDFAGDFLNSADTAATYKFLHDGTDHIIAAVWKAGTVSDPNNFYAVMGTNGNNSNNIGAFHSFDDRASQSRNDRAFTIITRGVASTFAVFNLSANGFFTPNTFVVYTSFNDPDNATAADRSEIYLNTGSALKSNISTDGASASNPTHVLQIGAGGNDQAPLTGSIAEIVVVSGADATEGNRVIIRDYLNAKWGVY